jgi:hypothetical protein
MPKYYTLRAGASAINIIRDEGLDPKRVRMIVGAAGGPKWLVIHGFDSIVFPSLFAIRERPLFLLGSSIGSWRFAALASKDPVTSINIFREAYCSQIYKTNPRPIDVTNEGWRILDLYLKSDEIPHILSHPFIRLTIMANRSLRPVASETRSLLMPGLGAMWLANLFSRGLCGCFFERTFFSDPRDIPPFANAGDFKLNNVKLTADNIRPAIMASGAIPLVMSAISDIPGAPSGNYRDSGMLDYHPAFDFGLKDDELALYPHYSENIIPGWLDKTLAWRRATVGKLPNAVLVAPSRELISSLPFKKIPDRNDFVTMHGRDEERITYWNISIEMGRRLAEEFMEHHLSGKLRKEVVTL